MTKWQRKASRNNKFYWKYPFGAESKLSNKLKNSFKPVAVSVVSKFNSWKKQYEPTIKLDESDEDFLMWLKYKREEVKKKFDNDAIWGILALLYLGNLTEEIANTALSEFERFLLQYTGEKYPIEIINWILHRRDFAAQIRGRVLGNIDLYFNKLESLYLQWKSGAITLDRFSSELNRVTQFYAVQKMEFTSKNLIGSLNSRLQRNIQQQLGVDTYFWQTMQDERVRGNPNGMYPKSVPSHFVMQGLLCSWSRPDSYSDDGKDWKPKYGKMEPLHAGEADGCRCIPVMWIGNVLSEIDREINSQ